MMTKMRVVMRERMLRKKANTQSGNMLRRRREEEVSEKAKERERKRYEQVGCLDVCGAKERSQKVVDTLERIERVSLPSENRFKI